MWSPNGSTTLDRVDGPMTEREREVLRLLALGHTNREVAERLVLSVRTVESHRENIQRKLGVRSRAELTNAALELGLFEPG
jgi:two-component system, NarL family, response regulator NreC